LSKTFQFHLTDGFGRKHLPFVAASKQEAERSIRHAPRPIHLCFEGLFGPHDGLHHLHSIWVTETSNSSVANIDMSGRVRSRFRISDGHNDSALFRFVDSAVSSVRSSLGKPSKKLSHWTRGLSVSGSSLYVGQSTWANSDFSKTRIVRVDRESGHINDIFPIELSGYSEARIFQLHMT
jgi:hypothetical protein